MGKYERGDVVTVLGVTEDENQNALAYAVNENARILREILDRLEKLEEQKKRKGDEK